MDGLAVQRETTAFRPCQFAVGDQHLVAHEISPKTRCCPLTLIITSPPRSVGQEKSRNLGTSDEQEYPEGEEQDPDGESETLGYGNGFGIKVAIYHNFLANRTPADFRAFLKNRRIPKHTKFAKELARVFAESQPTT